MNRPRIVCAGMCNTKGPEIKFLAQMVSEQGGEPIVMDLSLGAAVDWADISLQEVLDTSGATIEEVFAAPRAAAIAIVGHAGALKIVELRAAGRCDGIISWAGSVGTTTVTAVMRALPFGVPKVMLTDMAASDVRMWLGNKDIYIASPLVEQGINVVSRKAVANAAAAVVAMAGVPEFPAGSKPLAALTSYGTTTPTVLRCQEFIAARGWETSIFHAVGPGSTMEDLIRSGLIGAVYDITLGELTNTMVGSAYGMPPMWEGERLTAASDMGIPQVVAPGGLDQAAHGPLDGVPSRYLDEIRTERRRSYRGTGLPYQHNDSVTILPVTLEEIDVLAGQIARGLNRAIGPTHFFLPMRGWSAYDQSEALATRERGWSEGNGAGPVWEPDPHRPSWSAKATRMLAMLTGQLDRSNPNLDLLACDMHILDVEFAGLLNRCMGDMLDGDWRPGLYRDVAGVIDPRSS